MCKDTRKVGKNRKAQLQMRIERRLSPSRETSWYTTDYASKWEETPVTCNGQSYIVDLWSRKSCSKRLKKERINIARNAYRSESTREQTVKGNGIERREKRKAVSEKTTGSNIVKKTDFITRARFTLALPFAAFDEQRQIFRVFWSFRRWLCRRSI